MGVPGVVFVPFLQNWILLSLFVSATVHLDQQKVPGSVFATRESLLEARISFGGGEVKPERPQGGTRSGLGVVSGGLTV